MSLVLENQWETNRWDYLEAEVLGTITVTDLEIFLRPGATIPKVTEALPIRVTDIMTTVSGLILFTSQMSLSPMIL